MVCRRKMYVFVSELCVLGDMRQFLLAYCINIILYMTTAELSKRQQIVRTAIGSQELEGAPMDVRMRQALEAFAQGKLSIDDLLALARQIAESGVLAAPIDGLYSLRSHK